MRFTTRPDGRTPTAWFPRKTHAILLAAVLVAITNGCGAGGDRASVTGKVTIDGVALEKGTIRFSPTGDNRGPTAGANIENGLYSINAAKGPAPGWNLAAISGWRKTGKQIRGPDPARAALVDELIPVVPQQSNSGSSLTRQLSPGRNVMDFELSSRQGDGQPQSH